MVKLPKATIVLIICIDLFSPITSMKHNIDEFLVEDQRTHMRKQNYVRQRALANDALGDGVGVAYALEPYEPEVNPPGELPPLIVDYANMIRNDIILLDNSVETRTRKRGDVSVDKNNKSIRDLGENYYPRFIETKKCNKRACSKNYTCQPSSYNLTVLKRKTSSIEQSDFDIPDDLGRHWIARSEPITVGCVCTSEYVQN